MAESVFHVEGSTSTLLGILNQFHGASDLVYNTLLGTTLNSKYNVLGTVGPPALPLLRYFGMGINGFYNTDDMYGRAPHQPMPTNMDLYEPIPFRCVPLDEDLTAEERAQYRIRQVKEINGIDYCLYWLKLIEYKPNTVEIYKKTPDGAENTFSYSSLQNIESYLNPVPPKLSAGGETPLSQERYIVRATGKCVITGEEVAEAVRVLYEGNYTKGLISELGFYTGCDVYVSKSDKNEEVVKGEDGSPILVPITPEPPTATAKESVYTQLAKHKCFTGVDLSIVESEFISDISFEAGGVIDL